MRSGILLLVLLGLPAISLAAFCDSAIKNCAECATTAADSDCNKCSAGYFKEAAKTCTACPNGSGREPAPATTAIETNAVCTIKSAPQLKCAIASDRYTCLTCASAQYKEGAYLHGGEESGRGCSTDCKSFDSKGILQLAPNAETPAPATAKTICTPCSDTSGCAKCSYAAATKKARTGATPGVSGNYGTGQLTECTECQNGRYLKANTDATIVPTCEPCGANCKKCKDATACETCYSGWALDGTDKVNCLKSVAVSGNIIKAALISILALFIAW